MELKLTSEGYFVKKGIRKAVIKLSPFLYGAVLDFGCGSSPYKSIIQCSDYHRLDFDSTGHNHVGEDIRLFYNGHVLPFADMTYDSILATEVFEHVFNLPEVLAELWRVLVPNGVILLTCPFTFAEHESPADFARYTSFGIRHIMEQAGFEVIVQEKIGTSWQAMATLLQFYLKDHVTPKAGWFVSRCYTWGINVITNLLDIILPNGEELYLTNVIVCRKKT